LVLKDYAEPGQSLAGLGSFLTRMETTMAETNGLRKIGRRGWLFWVVMGGLAWLIATAATAVSSVRAYSIPTSSMAPALKPGDRIGVDIRPRRRPRRGEVWVFAMPRQSGSTGTTAVKRVIGLPGETVEVRDGTVVINGRPIAEPYLTGPVPYAVAPVKLGPGEYYVLGDNRGTALDSHVWGPLSADALIGPAKLRYWPLRRVGGL
jgi:signal peptidase I